MSANSAELNSAQLRGTVTRVELGEPVHPQGFRVSAERADYDGCGWQIEFWAASAPRVGAPVTVTVEIGDPS